MDGNQYNQSRERFTDDTGRKYQLIPIYLQDGVFHPKIFLFLSKKEQKVILYIGSSNITLTGFTRNAELISKSEYTFSVFDSNFVSILDFFKKIVDNRYVIDMKAKKVIHQTIEMFPSVETITQNPKYQVFHNIESPILPAMLNEVESMQFNYTRIMAPFFSQGTSVLRFLLERLDIKKVNLSFQQNNHNLIDPKPYFSYLSSIDVDYEINEAVSFDDDTRIFHSKIIHLFGKKQYLLMGSPNFTRKALLETSNSGNMECAIIFKDIEASNLIEQIVFKEVTNFSDISPAIQINNEDIDNKNSLLKIYSAQYDDILKIVDISTEPISEEVSIFISIDGTHENVVDHTSLHSGECSIKIPKGIPKEVEIVSNSKKGVRRIFFDRNFFLRNVHREDNPFSEISRRLSQDYSLDNLDINSIILGLAQRNQTFRDYFDKQGDMDRVDEEEKKNSSDKGTNKNKKILPKPSKIHKYNNINSSLIELDRLYLSILHFIKEERYNENTSLDEDGTTSHINESFKNTSRKTTKTDHHNIEKLITRHIQRLDDIILSSLQFTKDKNNYEEEIIQSQISYLWIILRSYPKIMQRYHFEDIINKLEKNINNIHKKQGPKKVAISLFKPILTISYCFNIQVESTFKSDIFSIFDFINDEVYFDIKADVIDYIEHTLSDILEFDIEKYQHHICSLLAHVVNSETIGQAPLEIIRAMDRSNNQEVIDFYGNILKKLKYGSWNKPYGRFSLKNSRKIIRSEYDEFTNFEPIKVEYIKDFMSEP